jgi:hypothetical protein
MARRDLLHESAKHALQKDGWLITHDPYILPFGLSVVEIDLGAERLIAAERGTERIAVEVKSFLADSTLVLLPADGPDNPGRIPSPITRLRSEK